MRNTRIRWLNVARLAAGAAVGTVLIALAGAALRPKPPEPLPPDVGLGGVRGQAVAFAPPAAQRSSNARRDPPAPAPGPRERVEAEARGELGRIEHGEQVGSGPGPAPGLQRTERAPAASAAGGQHPSPPVATTPTTQPATSSPPPSPSPAPPPTPPAPAEPPHQPEPASEPEQPEPARPRSPSQFGFER